LQGDVLTGQQALLERINQRFVVRVGRATGQTAENDDENGAQTEKPIRSR
jgi:hypothetical protein